MSTDLDLERSEDAAAEAIDFEPCDKEKYPMLPQSTYLRMIAEMGETAHLAHVLAYVSKPKLVEMMRREKGTGEFERVVARFTEMRETLGEIIRTTEHVELRVLISGAALELEDGTCSIG